MNVYVIEYSSILFQNFCWNNLHYHYYCHCCYNYWYFNFSL